LSESSFLRVNSAKSNELIYTQYMCTLGKCIKVSQTKSLGWQPGNTFTTSGNHLWKGEKCYNYIYAKMSLLVIVLVILMTTV